MKYPQRKEKLPYLIRIYKELGLRMIPFPGGPDAPFRGSGRVKMVSWRYQGCMLIWSSFYKKSFEIAKKLFDELYTKSFVSTRTPRDSPGL